MIDARDGAAGQLDWGRKGFFAALGNDTLTLLIYGPIGGNDGEHVVRAAEVVQRLQEFQGGTINVYINSPGGFVSEAMAVYNALLRHPARKLVQIDGVCASAATIIAMAGDRITAAEGAMIMVHAVSNTVNGDAADMRREADTLDKLTDTLVRLYMRRTGRGRAEVARWVTEETWFTAAEARAVGLIDEVSAASRAVASWDLGAYGLKQPPERTDGAGAGVAIAELQREVRELRAQVAGLAAAGGSAEASAVVAGLGETFHEWLGDFKDVVMEALQTDPALQDAAEALRADIRAGCFGGDGHDDEQTGASAAGETELARLLERVKRGPIS